jgi:deoxyribodipyrimidine photo-lyase
MKIENLVWLRNDLRLIDNPALNLAQQNGHLRLIFIICIEQWKKHNESDARIGLKLDRVKQIGQELNKLGIQIDVLECDWFHQTPKLIKDYCLRNQIQNIWYTKETPYDENQRDDAVNQTLQAANIQVHPQPYDLVISQPVFNLSGEPFKVFTAYYNRWLIMLENQNNQIIPEPSPSGNVLKNDLSVLEKYNFEYRKDIWPISTEKINQRLINFSSNKIFDYEAQRDYPMAPATSLLSPYLALGCIGPRQCLTQIKLSYENNTTPKDIWLKDPWLRELTWRDYYRQLMIHYPHISKNQNFKTNTNNIPWRQDPKGYKAWCEGQTGFPIIDAAMRQLNQTGWMHNRLRMLSASFLTKLLFIDWRKGEKYFMQTLIDGEFCANNGGWQWSASTGCDSAPYFRVFNPTLQSKKFDTNGDFIRKFVPELAQLDKKSIHQPSQNQCQECNYPLPIINYKTARIRAIEVFKKHI